MFLFVSLRTIASSFVYLNILSVLPESARWMISKGHYKQAEILLRKMAKTNRRTFDEEAFQQLKTEQEKVNNINYLPTDQLLFIEHDE
jgi:hypothetical protein